MNRMKQLARTAVYWPHIDSDIENTCRKCSSCAEQQNCPPKAAIHPWMMPEKVWSRVHVDHAVNFLGTNWLVMTDALSKYPCIHATSTITTRATIDLLEEDFSHFGYPHAVVTDNGPSFTSGEFKAWCAERGIVHLTGAPYHPATNGAAERLIQTFKQSMKKSQLPVKKALSEFLMHYRRTPTSSGLSPSELLNGRQLRTKLDTLMLSPAHVAQSKQAKEATISQCREGVAKVAHSYAEGDAVYALYYGPQRDRDPRWVPAVVLKRLGTRCLNVRVVPRGPVWRRHVEQLRPRYGAETDDDPGEIPCQSQEAAQELEATSQRVRSAPTSEFLPGNPRRSKRTSKRKHCPYC